MKKISILLAALVFAPAFAHAHTGAGDTSGFAHGFSHPLLGLDHLLAMIAIGLWAAQIGGRALWAVPLTFVAAMAAGGALGIAGLPLFLIEQGIATSVLLLGVLIALAVRVPLALSAPLAGLFAIFHGYAHGAEMPANASGLIYATGFMLATALLHGVGIGLGIAIQRVTAAPIIRLAGIAIAAVGVYLLV